MRTRGLGLTAQAADDLLAGLVHDLADRLRVKEATVVTAYLAGLDVGALADDVVRADAEQRQEIADASPAVISIERTGRLVAALAQAVRCVSLNHEQLAGEPDGKGQGLGVLDDAGNGLTLLGDALGRHHRAPAGRRDPLERRSGGPGTPRAVPDDCEPARGNLVVRPRARFRHPGRGPDGS